MYWIIQKTSSRVFKKLILMLVTKIITLIQTRTAIKVRITSTRMRQTLTIKAVLTKLAELNDYLTLVITISLRRRLEIMYTRKRPHQFSNVLLPMPIASTLTSITSMQSTQEPRRHVCRRATQQIIHLYVLWYHMLKIITCALTLSQ